MSSQLFPKKNQAFITYTPVPSVADGNIFQSNPTLATGDAKVSIDGGAFTDLTTLPDVDPNSSVSIKVALSASEMNGDNIVVWLHDAAGTEWKDVFIEIQTADYQVNDLAREASVDTVEAGIAAVQADTDNIQTRIPAALVSGRIDSSVGAMAADVMTAAATAADYIAEISTAIAALLTATVADSIPADGTRPSIASGILMLNRILSNAQVSGNTMTVFKEDGTTVAMTFTLDSSSNPTSITRAS